MSFSTFSYMKKNLHYESPIIRLRGKIAHPGSRIVVFKWQNMSSCQPRSCPKIRMLHSAILFLRGFRNGKICFRNWKKMFRNGQNNFRNVKKNFRNAKKNFRTGHICVRNWKKQNMNWKVFFRIAKIFFRKAKYNL